MSTQSPLFLYLGTIVVMTAILASCLPFNVYASGARGWMLALIGSLSLICASHLAVALVNWVATVLATPHLLPRMDFSQGIPPESRTLVVIPTMLTSAQGVEDLVEGLEVRFLANRDASLHFALLTDFPDARAETIPEDEPLLRLGRERIDELNAQYGNLTGERFFLFHRPRAWNPQEGTWMGYERKRGKLGELNALLRHGKADGFSLVVGETAVLSNVKYVITLDTDTQLPRDSAWKCVGAMAHPLNRPRYDEARQRVCEGYGILQPRVAVSLPGTNRSRYARLYGSEPGIDPYTRAVSDVYQDLFREGSYIGKGIYDVEAFEQALAGRLPENLILSHDLVEGCYARSGLLSDVQVYEEYPSTYPADVGRRRRWIRGDWQVLRWVFPSVPGPDAQPPEESALAPVPLEDPRQPASEPRAVGADAAVPGDLDHCVAALALDPGGDRDHPDPSVDGLAPGVVPQDDRRPAASASCGRRAICRPALRPGGVYTRVSPLRGRLQSGGDCAHGRTPADHSHPAAGVESVRQPGSPESSHPRRLLSHHVGRPRRGHGSRAPVDAGPTGRARGRRTSPGSLARRACHRLVDQPAAGSPRGKAERRSDRLSPEAVPKDLGVLRDVRRPRRSLAPP